VSISGHKKTKLDMKKTLFSLIAFCLCFSLFAQNKQSNEKKTDENKPVFLTKETFKQKVLNYQAGDNEWNYLGDKPCLIDFYASWCGPCRMLSPHLDEMSKKFAGQIYIYKIDTQSEKELAALFRIASIPSLLFVPVGDKQPVLLRGYRDAQQLENEINKYLFQK
jgi:thioredoxin